MSRRRLLGGLGSVVALGSLGGCAGRDRSSVLQALVREVLVGMAGELQRDTASLHGAIRLLHAAPTAQTLADARAAWKPTLVAWKRAQAFRVGPFADSGAFERALFWPTSPSAIERELVTPGPVDSSRVGALPADARGLHALEYLLFAPNHGDTLASHGDVRRAYALELSGNVRGYAERIVRLLGDGRRFSEAFANAGERSVAALAAQSLDTLDIVLGKLARSSRARAAGSPLASAVEGHYSGTSRDVVHALVTGTQRLYVGGPGGGLSELVARVSAPIDGHTRFAFSEAESRLRALTQPFELAAEREPERYRAMADSLTALRHIFATETSSALEG